MVKIVTIIINKRFWGQILLKTSDEIYLNADYNRLKQVFINLLKNTIEARNENEKLIANIKLTENKKSILLTIEDNGLGMDKDTLSKYAKLLYGEACLISGAGIDDPVEHSNLVCELMTK